MPANKKALELAAELADELRKRFSVAYSSIVEGFDANGNPTIALNDGTPATTEDAVFIRITPRDWGLTKDVLGSAQTVYTPNTIQIAVEATATGLGLAGFVSNAHALAIFNAIARRGCRVEYWQETNGTAPSVTTFDTANKLKATDEPSLYWPLLSSQ